MNCDKRAFLLLQINDAAFPIGAYSHSGGLETYVQAEKVTNSTEARDYLKRRLHDSFLYNELLAAKLAYEYASAHELDSLEHLEELYRASRSPREIREASEKMGNRFVKTMRELPIEYEDKIFMEYLDRLDGSTFSHPIAYGLFCYAAGIDYDISMQHFLYSQVSAVVTNCVKSIPLSQTEGQKLLLDCEAEFETVLEKLETLTEKDLSLSAPGFDIRSMQHENLYSRLYMS